MKAVQTEVLTVTAEQERALQENIAKALRKNKRLMSKRAAMQQLLEGAGVSVADQTQTRH